MNPSNLQLLRRASQMKRRQRLSQTQIIPRPARQESLTSAPYPMPIHKPYSAEQVRAFFLAAGLPISTWAETNGYTRHDVYCVLGGQRKATRGKCHEIALKLGIKLSVAQLTA